MPPSYEVLKSRLNSPECDSFIKALVDCREENKFMIFLGTCEIHATALDKCIREQKELNRPKPKRRLNKDQARAPPK